MASVRDRIYRNHRCCGILVHRYFVLTVAHCAELAEDSFVHVGAYYINDGYKELGEKVMLVS